MVARCQHRVLDIVEVYLRPNDKQFNGLCARLVKAKCRSCNNISLITTDLPEDTRHGVLGRRRGR